MLEYMAPLIAFLAALIALRGETWDKRKKGIRRVTPTGWLVTCVALASLAVTAGQIRHNQVEDAQRAVERARIRQVAYSRIASAVNMILDSLELLHQVNSGRAITPEEETTSSRDAQGVTTPRPDMIERSIAQLKDEHFIKSLDKFHLTASPGDVLPGILDTWAEHLESSAVLGERQLQSVIDLYRDALDAETIELIQRVCSHQFLFIMGAARSQLLRNPGRQDSPRLTVAWALFGPYKPEEFYVPFLDLCADLIVKAKRVQEEAGPRGRAGTPSN